MKSVVVTCLLMIFVSASVLAQGPVPPIFTTLVNFDFFTNGSSPIGSLVQGRDGNIWGTTEGGRDANAFGGVFKMTPAGTLTLMHSFDGTDGELLLGGLTLGTDGIFYGSASSGEGNVLYGSLFGLTSTGAFRLLHAFNFDDGWYPFGSLLEGPDGNLYGTTASGGAYKGGTFFKMTRGGSLTALYNFDPAVGSFSAGGLILGRDGNFYGASTQGGSTACYRGCGSVFKLSPTGAFTLLHSFTGATDGAGPASLVQGKDGNFYGTTSGGGDLSKCSQAGCGTVYTISNPGLVFTVLHNFGPLDGFNGSGALVQGSDGAFYGVTGSGGPHHGFGTIFWVTARGRFRLLHSFSGTDGREPSGALLQHTNGKFYGTTQNAGTGGGGILYSLDLGFGPFIRMVPTSRIVGSQVGILGTGMTGTTAVSFNGTPAPFTVASDTFITATVPVGATNGPVQVTTPGGTLTTQTNFRIR